MKILQLIKTSDGAQWALEQVKVLISLGVDVHVVLPNKNGFFSENWRNTGAHIHILDTNLPLSRLDLFLQRTQELKTLIENIKPDLVHSHFFSSTIMMRQAMRHSQIKKIFQVPGPLHLENFFFRFWELATSNSKDHWIASSQYIKNLYLKSKINPEKIFLSYYGSDYSQFKPLKDKSIRSAFDFNDDHFVVGNLNYMYPPKWYLGQFQGVKRHEVLIKALNIATEKNKNIKGLIVGGQWGMGNQYEQKLKLMANNSIAFTGKVDPQKSHQYLANFDLLVHIPLSENCGGIVEPMHMNIPILAGEIGGLPELIQDEISGKIIKQITPEIVATAILEMGENYYHYKELAKNSREKISKMFNIQRTATEVFDIYKSIINS